MRKVPIQEKLFLSLGGFSSAFHIKHLILPVYQMTLGANPLWIGFILACMRFSDGFTDPFIGKLSDNYRSKYGRRRPFIFIGAILTALSFGLIWMVPKSLSETGILIYFAITVSLFYICHTIYSVPWRSLCLEMTDDYEERTSITSIVNVAKRGANLVESWVIPLAGASFFASVLIGTQVIGWFIAILLIGLIGIIPALFVKERYYDIASKQKPIKLRRTFYIVFSDKTFLRIISLKFFKAIIAGLISSLDYYLLVYYVHDGDILTGSYWKGILTTGYVIFGWLYIYPITKAAQKWGKKNTLIFLFIVTIIGSCMKVVIFAPGNEWIILLDPILCAPLAIGFDILISSMLADYCDEDEFKHGIRREGMIFSIYTWFGKTAGSLSALGAGIILTFSGFNIELGGNQVDSTINIFQIFISVPGAVLAMFSILILTNYKMTRENVEKNKVVLIQRRGEILKG